jgi:hypothetical protein
MIVHRSKISQLQTSSQLLPAILSLGSQQVDHERAGQAFSRRTHLQQLPFHKFHARRDRALRSRRQRVDQSDRKLRDIPDQFRSRETSRIP